MRTLAIDWSGAKSGARKKIWLAEARDGDLVRLEAGRTRREIGHHLLQELERDPRLIVGLDFAFSFPVWFLRDHELTTADELWQLADLEGEGWLAACEPPFWGRPGRPRPELPSHFRRTDAAVPSVGGVRPKSPFQVGGAGAVGTGSLRGMPLLHRLSRAGYAIWPFDPAEPPAVVEIYPRLLTGAVVKSSPKARARYLEVYLPELSARHRDLATVSDDAFDAAVSALALWREADGVGSLKAATDPVDLLEGRIWWPGDPRAVEPEDRDAEGWEEAGAVELAGLRSVLEGAPGHVAGPGDEVAAVADLLGALQFAAERHRDQRRKGAEASPYINHPIAVARLLAVVAGVSDPVLLQAAVLHDTVEDTETTPAELEGRFGPEVSALVAEVTDDTSLPEEERKKLQEQRAPSSSGRAKLLKIADKAANVVDITRRPPAKWSPERKRRYLDWAERVVGGCRGVSPALESHFDRKLKEARAQLGV